MGSWSFRGRKHQDIRLLQCLVVVCVVSACCTRIFGDELDCPGSIVTPNDAQLQIIGRKNHTRNKFCGASLETICFRYPEFDNCRTLLNLSVSLVAEDKPQDEVVGFEFHLLQSSPVAGKRWDFSCNVADLAEDLRSSDKVWSLNMWFDYDCCVEGQSQEMYIALLLVSYNMSESCEAGATVKLKPESKEVNSPVNTVTPKPIASADNSAAGDKYLPNKPTSLTGVVVAVVIAVVGAIVTIIVVYIVCMKCSNGRRSSRRVNSQSEQTPLQPETHENCRICHIDKVKVVAPEEDDSVSYSTIEDTSVIPPIMFPPSDEELTENQIDSGCFESMQQM